MAGNGTSRAERLVRIASKEDFAKSPLIEATLDGNTLVVCRVSGKYYAVSGTCTHQNWPLCDGHILGTHIICPLHGAEFDLKTGKCLTFHQTDPLRTYSVTELDDGLYIDMAQAHHLERERQ